MFTGMRMLKKPAIVILFYIRTRRKKNDHGGRQFLKIILCTKSTAIGQRVSQE